jgi:hypothetical protein
MQMKSFDFNQLRDDLVTASKQAFRDIASRYPDSELCAFALYSDAGAMTVCPAICTADFLDTKAAQHPDDFLFYKYSPSEWPLEGVGADDAFKALCTTVREHVFSIEDDDTAFSDFKHRLMETCVEAQLCLRREGLNTWEKDLLLLVTISDDDEPAGTLKDRVKRLNDVQAAEEFSAWADTWGR